MSDRRRILMLTGVCGLLSLAGNLLEPLAVRASRMTRAEGGAVVAGEGLTLAALGGMRTLVADVFWLRAYTMWERRDRAACTTFAKLALTLSPETESFKTGYASWLAFDFPHWAIAEAGGPMKVKESVREALNRADATAALEFLDEMIVRDPENPAYGLLAGQICDIKLKSGSRAAVYYKGASETPGAPWYPTWLYTDSLVFAGKIPEASAFMRRYAARVPAGSTRAVYAQEYLDRIEPRDSKEPR